MSRVGPYDVTVSWTKNEDDYLRSAWGVHPASHTANFLGRTRSAVSGRAYRLGLSVKKPSALRKPKGEGV